MPRKPLTYKCADVVAMIKLLEKLGKVATAVKVSPDGTFRVMTAEYKSVPDSNESAEAAFDSWKAKHARSS